MTEDAYKLTLDTFESGEARDKLRQATRIILDLEKEYATAVEDAADSEAVYRRQLAEAVRNHRDAGQPVEASVAYARADVAMNSRERDHAAGMLKLAAEKLEDARDARRSLWRLIEWARQRDAAAHPPASNGPTQMALDERAPRGWP
jgi:hypothetical protein